MDGFLQRLRESLQQGRSVTLPAEKKAAIQVLISAIFADDARALNDLLTRSGFDVNVTFHKSKRSLPFAACQAGAHECLSVLIKLGANVNASDTSGCTPLIAACRNGHKKCIKKLLAVKDVDKQAKDSTGLTGMHWLAVSGRTDSLAECVAHIDNWNVADAQGQTCLHMAAKNGHVKTMEFLIGHGSDVNKKCNAGNSALHLACSNGHLPGVELLLNHGAIYCSNKNGVFPLDNTVEGEHWDVLFALLDRFPYLCDALILLTMKDEIPESKVLGALQRISEKFGMNERLTLALADLAANVGLKLLTSFSIIDVELITMRRIVNVLTALCRGVPTAQIKKVKQALTDVWSSMEGWFNLIADKIAVSAPAPAMDGSELNPASPSSAQSPSVLHLTESPEIHTISPRIAGALELYYAVCLIGSVEGEATPDEFVQFVTAHEDVMRFLIRRDPDIIFENFHFLLDSYNLKEKYFEMIKIQPFEKRKAWFYRNLYAASEGAFSSGALEEILINRENLFSSSCHELMRRDPAQLKTQLTIHFKDEDGIGAGVVKDWFDALSQELLNPNYALFTVSPDGTTFQPSSTSGVNPDHLNYFNFAGQIIGLALYHKQMVNTYFTRSFYKHILGIPVSYEDVASIDPEYARNLEWLQENDISDLNLDLTFSVENCAFGANEQICLKPGGSKIPVTEANKKEYIQLVAEFRMTRLIQPQIGSFLQGFHKFIPRKLINMFDDYELEVMLSGIPDLDLIDWRANTVYAGYNPDDAPIQWFWEIVQSLSNDEQIQLLQFVTGSSRVPYGGFAHLRGGEGEQKFTIAYTQNTDSHLPTASTCVNMLKLPSYDSKEDMRQKIVLALNSMAGFQLV